MGEQGGTSPTGERQHYCRSCGSQIRAGVRFCTGCGRAVEASADQRPAPQPAPRPSSLAGGRVRRNRALAIGTGVVVVAGLATGSIVFAHPLGHEKLATTSSVTTPRATPTGAASAAPSTTPSASASASAVTLRQAAVNLAGLLSRSGSDRTAVNAAFNDVGDCGSSLSQDVQTFQAADTSRRQLLSELANLPGLTVLPAAMTQDLNAAWQASASADSDFAKWAQDQVANGCAAGNQSDPNYVAANTPDLRATKSKTAFVQLWDPLAQTYGLPTYSQSDL